MGRHVASAVRGSRGQIRGGLRARRTAILALGAVMGLLSAGAVAFAGPLPAGGGAERVRGTPCTVTARACVDLDDQEAWLIEDGRIEYGPVTIHSGGPGQESPTGTFAVQWKHDDHISGESGVPMPHSVFFAPGGIAFHEGDVRSASAGCIRMEDDDARVFYRYLQVGDEVQVVD